MTILLGALGAYVAIGLLFGLAFVWRGVNRIDPAAVDGGWGFRLLILPGAVIFWPYLGRRWWRGEQAPEEWSRHRATARVKD